MILVRKGSTLYFGITPTQVDHLKEGRPLHFHLSQLGPDLPFDCFIVVGESDAAIAAELDVTPENQPAKKLD